MGNTMRKSVYQFLLDWAADKGHHNVVKLLLSKEEIEVNKKAGKYGLTPLNVAALCDHEKVVCLLLAKEGIQIN